MPFAIKYRRAGRPGELSPETLAVDIESHDEARAMVDRLAASYPQNGRHRPTARWFRNRSGLHLIWVQPQ